MTNHKNIPALRFKEFVGEWEVKKLGELAKFSKGKGISKKDISDDGIECIRYGELYTTYGEIIDEIQSKTTIDKNELVFSQANDVIIPASGETAFDIATASCVINDGIALGGDLNIIRTKINGVFLSYYLNNTLKIPIARLAQGVSVSHLYSSQLKTLKLNLPTKPEQQKIANFLTTIDTKIQQLRQKEQLLDKYKKGVMQQIFKQEIRFKDDDGGAFEDWEVKRLGEVAIKKSSNISANSLQEQEGDFLIYGAAGILRKIDFYQEEKAFISIVKDGAGVGRVLLCKPKSSVLGTLDIIKPKNNVNVNFLFSLLERINFLKYVVGSTIPHIYFKDYKSEKLLLPSLPEQQKIANFLSSIDKRIASVKAEIVAMEAYKKGLLQVMFV